MRNKTALGTRLPRTDHTDRPWRIHEVCPDFAVEDVWALPTPGGPDDFDRLMSHVGRHRPEDYASPIGKLLWAVRWKLGAWLGWDRRRGIGTRVASLRQRLPGNLLDAAGGPDFPHAPFTSLYRLPDEFAAEIANRTMHGVMHLSWVEDGRGGHRGQMAVLVKPNGVFGRAYMAAIKPFRLLFIYPALMRRWERDWGRPRSNEEPAPCPRPGEEGSAP